MSNKLIAEFMGFTSEKNIGWYDNNMMMPQNVYDTQNGNCFDELLFDQSWDWLIPVVEKVFILSEDEEAWRMDIESGLTTLNINETYRAVVEFIKTYKNKEDERRSI